MTILGFGRNKSAADNSDSNNDKVAKDGIVPLKVEAKSAQKAQKKYKRDKIKQQKWQKTLDEFIRLNPDCDDTGCSGYYTVQEVVENFKPTLEKWKKQKNKGIKKDGALDKLRINGSLGIGIQEAEFVTQFLNNSGVYISQDLLFVRFWGSVGILF